jgi:predicted DNA-binding transcriptional regulator AlpA
MSENLEIGRHLTEAEVAVVTGMKVYTLQNWRNRGQGPPFRKFGSAVRYDSVELAKWIAAQPSGGEPAVSIRGSDRGVRDAE